MKLAEIDHKQVITLAPSDSVSRAFTLMVEHDIRHLPIVEDERVVGIVSDRDLLIIVSWIGAWKSLMHESTVVGKKRVAELMSSPVTVLSREDKIESAARLMLDKRFSAIPIEEQGRLINIVTETDVLRCCVGESSISASRAWRELKVFECMSQDVVTASPSDHVMPSFHLMKEKQIRHLPIVDEGKLVGLISERDLRRSYGKEIAVNLARDEPNLEMPYHYTLKDAMSYKVETTNGDASLVQATCRMLNFKIGALPVTEGDQLVGIITETDLLRVFVEHAEA